MAYNSKLVILLFLVSSLLFGVSDRAMAFCQDGVLEAGEVCDDGVFPSPIPCGFAGSCCRTCNVICSGYVDDPCCFDINPCNQNPTVVITPLPPNNTKAGTAITYTVTVTNNDDSVCGMCVASSPRNFNLTMPLIDAGLNYTIPFVSNSLTVNAGGSSSTTFEVSSNATAGLGVYNFTVQAEDGNVGAGIGTFTITSTPEICDNGIDDSDPDLLVDCLDPDCLGHFNCCGNGILEAGVEACDSDADCPGAQVCNTYCSACINFIPSKKCAYGFDDCDCDGICETDILSDVNNCGMCGSVCGSVCVNGSCSSVAGGIVPCGRMSDDPATVWNEQEDCKICHLIILTDSIIGWLLKMVGIIAVLSLVVGGVLYIVSSGNSNLITVAKTAFRKSLSGFVIVFIAWVITNTTMVLFGFNDPLGDGSWHKFDCTVSTTPPSVYICGDGVVTSPNDDGILEVCDPKELLATFIARKTAMAVGCGVGGGCPNGCFFDKGVPDPDCPFAVVAWVRELYSCNHATCDFGCVADPLVDEIGGGCYLDINNNLIRDPNECQKGRYTCDFVTNTVFCENTYSDLDYKLAGERCEDVYDYCCEGLLSGFVGFNPAVFDGARIIYPGSTYSCDVDKCDGYSDSGVGDSSYIQPTDFIGSTLNPPHTFYYTYNCDTVCKNHGGDICIGVGVGDMNALFCDQVTHDMGASCNNPGNLIPADCTVTFRYWDSHSCWESVSNHVFPVGSTACICK